MVLRIFLDKPLQACRENVRKCWTTSAFNIRAASCRLYSAKGSCVSVLSRRDGHFHPQQGQALKTVFPSLPSAVFAMGHSYWHCAGAFQSTSSLRFCCGWNQSNSSLLDPSAVHCLSLQNLSPARVPVRYKSKKKKGKDTESESDSDEDDALDEDDFDAPATFKVMKIHVASMRADAIISNSLDISRNRLEELFFGPGFLLNGTRMLKKSSKMEEGDHVDVVLDKTDSQLRVKRVKLLKVLPQKTSTEKFVVKVRVWKAPFTLDNSDSEHRD